MPLYEYQCRSCGQRTEVLQSFSDAPRTVCEACGGELKKLISAPAVQFKGSGWYVTDYAKSGSTTKPGSNHPSSWARMLLIGIRGLRSLARVACG